MYLVPPGVGPAGSFDHLRADYDLLADSAKRSGLAGAVAATPDSADYLLFVGTRDVLYRDIRSHPLFRSFRFRSVVYDSNDRVIPLLPGIYPSIERRYFDARRTRSGFYLRWSDSRFVEYSEVGPSTRYLFAFVGSTETHPVRKKLLALRHPRGLVRDTSSEPGRGFGKSVAVYEDYRRRYGKELAAARFILCPRGAGVGSMRVFEAMKAGRVPIVISDDWVPPTGPEWETFSVRVAEDDAARIPDVLESIESRGSEMGALARREWERHFSPEAAFDTVYGWSCLLAQNCMSAGMPERLSRGRACLQLLRPHFARYVVLPALLRPFRRSRIGGHKR